MSSSKRLRDGREPTLLENVQDVPGLIAELGIQASSIVSVLVSPPMNRLFEIGFFLGLLCVVVAAVVLWFVEL